MNDAVIHTPEAPVLVIGGAGMDIVGWIKGELHPASSAPAHIRSSYGGVARNVAENLAHLGQQVRLITAVGEDDAGDQLVRELQTAGVDTHAILHTDAFRTGAYLAVIEANGGLKFALDDMRVISALTPAYIEQQWELFRDASLVFVDANLTKETLRKVFTLARKARLPVCADPTSTRLAQRIKTYLQRCYLLTPNLSEAAQLCEMEIKPGNRRQALQAAKCLVNQGVETAILTLAEHGLCYATSETSGHIPAMRTPIVDQTGGGDALTAAVIFALLNDIPLDDAVRLGVSAASLTLRYRGAVVPDLTLEKLYDQLVI
jgi:pseudouridine kinase